MTPEVRRRPNLTIQPHTLVSRILFEGTKAIGTPPIMGQTSLATWFDGWMNTFETVGVMMEDVFVTGNEAALIFNITARQGINVTTFRDINVFAIDGQGKIVSLAGYP